MRISNYKWMLVALLIFFSRNVFADLDTTFGTGGIVTTSIGDDEDIINGVTLQSSNTHIVAVGSTIINDQEYIALARYIPTGSLDSSFSSDGIQTLTIGTRAVCNKVAIQTDGKIVLGCFSYEGRTNFTLVRYNNDGSLDATFNSTGIQKTQIGTGAQVNALKILSNGKILVGGAAVSGGSPQFTLARYSTTGSLEVVLQTPLGFNSAIHDIAIQSDGKIMAAGYTNPGNFNQFALVRYNTNGSLDTTFGLNGIVVTPIKEDAIIYDARLQSDGKIVVGGTAFQGNKRFYVIARYNANGTLDTTFNSTGFRTVAKSGARARAIALQSDGKIVIAGSLRNRDGRNFALARFNTDGSLDATFGVNGIESTIIGTTAEINSIVIQPDDKIIAAGFSDGKFAIARYEAQ